MLPEIRTMSPLQVPRPSQIDPASFHETFTPTKPSPSTNLSRLQSTTSPTTSATPSITSVAALLPPHSLRKSISVDSFINNRRSPDPLEPGNSSAVQQHEYSRDTLNGGRRREVNETFGKESLDTNTRLSQPTVAKSFASRIFGRTRGHSLSGPSVVTYDDPYLDDSEHERVSDLVQLPSLSSQRSQTSLPFLSNGSSKGKNRLRPADGLLLPPRSSVSSTLPSSPSLNAASLINSTVLPAQAPPLHTPHSRKPIPNPLVLPSSHHSRISTEPREAFSIGIVGTFGCGKTTMIRKGLKVWGVSEESISTISTPKGRIRYGIRTINASRENDITASIIEVDSDNLSYDTSEGAWPNDLPHIDGVLVLYDASDPASFVHVPELIAAYHSLELPVIVVACKCDLEIRVLPHSASERTEPYGIGLIEVTAVSESGRRKMRYTFQWLIRSIEQAKRGDIPTGPEYPNPASPDILSAPWSEGYSNGESRSSLTRSRIDTPTGGSPSTVTKKLSLSQIDSSLIQPSSTPTPRPAGAISPTRVKSVGDLLTEVERSKQEGMDLDFRQGNQDRRSSSLTRNATLNGEKRSESLTFSAITATTNSISDPSTAMESGGAPHDRSISNESQVDSRNSGQKEPPSMPWGTQEELLDKLFFLAVSGDDPTFIKHFLLTYRKFATPRTVLLGMQKRVRQLNKDHFDLLLGNYAQMRYIIIRTYLLAHTLNQLHRICDLLEEWISTYPTDFATPGTHGAIVALVKQISSNPCTLHYGSDILPFLDELPRLKDLDSSWALPCEDPTASDESDTLLEDEMTSLPKNTSQETFDSSAVHSSGKDTSSVQSRSKSSIRERKASLPLSTKSLTSPTGNDSHRLSSSRAPLTLSRNSLKDLIRLSSTLSTYDPEEIAQQITKMQSDLFLAIEPRQWLRYAMSETRSQKDPISAVSSLILAHDKVKAREKQVERFVDLAQRLRYMNNYVGLRAVMTGINNATYPNDQIMSLFRDSKIRLYQQYLGWEILLNSQHNHRAYRMALRNTDGPTIPDMEVHTFDMVRANDSNPNYKSDDPTKIHWGKFTLMARMILMLQGLQDKIRLSRQFDFPERKWIREMVLNEVMDIETIRSRIFVPAEDAEPIFPFIQGPDSPSTSRNDMAGFTKKLFYNISGKSPTNPLK
ncbi:hypothetical protein Clacol_003907 [Clathrus columnatus]|uniref:Ras GEF n=1 Tax=Clathrus columnatus TaxID=1419009 RepID=A0AAV5A933_9AGAM|nr:hypothetical protein Clacol_003907 [Clathrus columnatus]